MVALPTLANSALAKVSSLLKPGASPEKASLDVERDELFSIKQGILASVKAAASNGEWPTLEQYRLACEKFATETDEGKKLVSEGKWNPKVYADLSGQKLDGFRITEPKIQKDYDGNNLDGDGQINAEAVDPFYDNVRFQGSELRNCLVEPATSFNDEICKALKLDHITFNDMREGDTFRFAKDCENVTLNNVRGGQIIVGESCKIDGLDIRGVHASLCVGAHASISHIHVDDRTRILSFELEPGAMIAHSDLRQATIDMSSKLAETKWQDVKLSGNLSHVNFEGAQFSNVMLDGVSVKGTNFAGARLNKVEFNNVTLADLDLTDVARFDQVMVNGTKIANAQEFAALQKEEALRQQVADIGGTLMGAMKSLENTLPAAPSTIAALKQTPTPTLPNLASLVTGGETVTFNQVAISTEVAANVARTQPLLGQGMTPDMPA